MTRRSWIYVATDPVNHAGWVAGYGARELVTRAGGRPLWSRSRRSWSTSEATAIDVVAMAEAEGYAVRYEHLERDSQ